jgi:hypothetical protein
MDNLTFNKIKEALEKYNGIAVVTRKDPSVDEMAGALSLYLSLKQTGKSIVIATPNDPLVEVSSLVGIDEVKTNLGASSGDLVVSFPYKEGEIEKVSYTREDNLLNIVVKAGENGLTFEEKDVKFTRGMVAPELLFVVGSSRVSDLGQLFDPQVLKDTVVVNIDNKADNQGYGDILMVSTRLSSVCEAITNLILSIDLKMDLDIAQNLMLGLAVSTNNFQSDNTSPLAFEMAGILLRHGALRPQSQPVRRKLQTASESFDNELPQPQIIPSNQPLRQTQRRQPSLGQVQAERVKKPEVIKQQEELQDDNTLQSPPDDWLEPKIYKGSTSF